MFLPRRYSISSLHTAKIQQTSEMYEVYFRYITASALYLRTLVQRYIQTSEMYEVYFRYITASAFYFRTLVQR